jgi:hypothetical protein
VFGISRIDIQSEETNEQQLQSDRGASDLYNLANSLFMECKQAAQPSDLDRAVYFLREALNRRPAPHPHRSDLLNDLAEALVERFWHSGQPQDLGEAIMLHHEAFKLRKDGLETVIDAGYDSQPLVRLLPYRLHPHYKSANIPG